MGFSNEREKSKAKEIAKQIRKLNYWVYVFIALVGVVMLIGSNGIAQASHPFLYSCAISIGCGLISSAIVGYVITAFIPDQSGAMDSVRDWGVDDISNDRFYSEMQELPKHNLDIVAFGLTHFRRNISRQKLEKQIKKGLQVRILIPNPGSIFVKEREKLERSGTLNEDIQDLINWLNGIKLQQGSKGTLEYRIYNSLPQNYYSRWDANIYVGPYLPHEDSNQTITYRYKEDSKGGSYYSEIFEDMWSGNKDIHIISADRQVLTANQEAAVESVLSYFCANVQSDAQKSVVGIVVIFKENMRRTFYSCNKSRTHNCHKISDGSVGAMCKLNGIGADGKLLRNFRQDAQKSVYFYCDYTNQFSYEYEINGRTRIIKKSSLLPQKMETSSEAKAILAAPVKRDDRVIGAITFDFADFPSAYDTYAKTLKGVAAGEYYDADHLCSCDDEEKRIALFYLQNLFENAGAANKIIVNMMGQQSEMSYDSLYWGKWELS